MSIDEKRVREFAFQIWESEGKPEGQAERHWQMAIKLAESEASAPAASKSVKGKTLAAPNPAIPTTKKPAKAEKPALLEAKPAKPAAKKPAAKAVTPKASTPKTPTPKVAPEPSASKPPVPAKKPAAKPAAKKPSKPKA